MAVLLFSAGAQKRLGIGPGGSMDALVLHPELVGHQNVGSCSGGDGEGGLASSPANYWVFRALTVLRKSITGQVFTSDTSIPCKASGICGSEFSKRIKGF